MPKLILVRHGESQWNKENRFTGWTDVDLTDLGKKEAANAALLIQDFIKKEKMTIDTCFTSVLKRAIRTLWIILDNMDLQWLPVFRSWRLNERHYGALQGLNKKETAEKHGEKQVQIWRRSYSIAPPALEESDSRHPAHDPRYKNIKLLPSTESLKITLERVLPYWNQSIVPELKANKNVLIVAHGNSLRALVKHLDQIAEDEIVQLNIPTGAPLVYDLKIESDGHLKPLSHQYLGDPDAVKKAAEKVAIQTKTQ